MPNPIPCAKSNSATNLRYDLIKLSWHRKFCYLWQHGTPLRGELDETARFPLTSVLIRFPDCKALSNNLTPEMNTKKLQLLATSCILAHEKESILQIWNSSNLEFSEVGPCCEALPYSIVYSLDIFAVPSPLRILVPAQDCGP